MKKEALKRGIEFDELIPEDNDDTSNESYKSSKGSTASGEIQVNAQDPDTDTPEDLKAAKKLKVLSEPELLYIKKMFHKNEQHWADNANSKELKRLHKSLKFTIRKISRQMASLDTHAFFLNTNEPTLENTRLLLYRAEMLYNSRAESEKIFQFVSLAVFDEEKLQEIVEAKTYSCEN